jgi:Amt family ammonium transporter
MSRQRLLRWGLSLALGLALDWGLAGRPGFAQEVAKEAPKDAAATAPAAAPAAPDPAAAPTAPDPTGANYTGASTTAALTKDGDEVTEKTLAADIKAMKMEMNIVWTLITGFLVMFMQTGFALLETGLCRAKNCAHTMAMNFMIYAIGLLAFWACGFAIMAGGWGPVVAMDGPNVLDAMFKVSLFGKDFELFGYKGFFLTGPVNDATVLTLFLFQMVFMDTAATIQTGALAERWKFSAFCVYGFFMAGFLYPVFGCWVWGGGWLADLGVNFGLGNGHVDFAGSSVVHMTGGVCALCGAWLLGPRIGKFNRDGSPNAIPAHNIPMVAVGTLILAFGWFGFNPGSSLAATDLRIGSIAVCTMLASGAGCFSAALYMWAVYGKPDPTMACNGLLAGLVAITAPCAFVNPVGAVLIGTFAGVLVIWAVLLVERVLKVDDPVGAVAVHGFNGAWGCLAIGLFATGEYGAGWNAVKEAPRGLFYGGGLGQLAAEAVGVCTNVVWVFGMSFLFFTLVKHTMGMRVSSRTEIEGLDIHEMGVTGYVNEDSVAVQVAGQEYLESHGPGVPGKPKPAEREVPVGRA